MSLLYTRPPRRRRPAPAQRIRVEEGGKKREGRRGREGERERGREGERERGSEGARERENLTVFGKLDFTPDACPTTKQAGPGKAKRAAESHPRNFCYLSGQGLAARKVASTHGTCPISTEGWTRRVHFVREGGGGGAQNGSCVLRASVAGAAPHRRASWPRGRAAHRLTRSRPPQRGFRGRCAHRGDGGRTLQFARRFVRGRSFVRRNRFFRRKLQPGKGRQDAGGGLPHRLLPR